MKLAFDTGGTFTDFAFLDPSGRVRVHKELSTPASPGDAVLEGIDTLLADVALASRSGLRVFGATTIVTNAVLERKGARTAFVTTRGFRDLLRIRTEARYDLYDLRLKYPEPLAPRDLCFGVSERMAADGTIVEPLDEAEVRAVARALREARVESVAVCLLHAPTFPAHERRIAEILAETVPDIAVSLSSVVAPELREYPRASTTTVNAYTLPVMRTHVIRLEEELARRGLERRLFVMTSSGGVVPSDAARQTPVRLIESGPAAGALAAAEYGRLAGESNVLSFDMGGTTAKLTLIPGGRPMVGTELEVARLERFKRGSGFPLKIQSIETFEIGAGGGSIASADQLGLLRVGPLSAGAAPGPACYGQGGTEPTVTDADLLLGYLDARSFLGGSFKLWPDAAAAAVERLADRLGVTRERCAYGIHDLVNENMAKAATAHASECGADLRNFALVAFGGAGPVHAYGVARKIGVRKILCPLGAGVMSAIGLLLAPVAFDVALSFPMPLGDWDAERARALSRTLGERARDVVTSAGVPDHAITLERSVDMRHVGQGYEITVALPELELPRDRFLAELEERFSRAYATLYGRGRMPGTELEIITWRLRAVGPSEAVDVVAGAPGAPGATARSSERAPRRVYFEELERPVDAPVYDHYALAPGIAIYGPAIVEQRESTAVVGPGVRATIDPHHNLVMELG
jgi:N-methylhydantoinase A